MLAELGRTAERWTKANPWTNVYGVARSLLALATAGTIVFNAPHDIFRPAAEYAKVPICEGSFRAGIFCVLGSHLEVARWLAFAILAVVASGWRPRLTAIPHWWVSFSVLSAIVQTGGDQVAAVLTLFLVPLAITDRRRWHWSSNQEESANPSAVVRLVASSSLAAVRLQVAGVYFVSAVAKFGVREWANGTALYYWMTDPRFGGPSWLSPILRSSIGVTMLTWGTLLLELSLGLAIFLPKQARRYLLIAGVVFHLSIALTIGISSFSLTMVAALVLYLRPPEEEFKTDSWGRRLGKLTAKTGLRPGKTATHRGRSNG